jgi:replication fork clamp-binding protein CrfC
MDGINFIKNEVIYLLKKGLVSRNQPIFILLNYITTCEWVFVENELEERNFKFSDSIGDLISVEEWDND